METEEYMDDFSPLRNILWEEIKSSKTNCVCAECYTNNRRNLLRIFDLIIVIISAIALVVSEWAYWGTYVASITTIVITSLKSDKFKFVQSESQLQEIDNLITFYRDYTVNIELLLYKLENNIEDEITIFKEFQAYKKEENSNYSSFNRLIRKITKKQEVEFQKYTDIYLNPIYYNQYENSEIKE